jgi:hypothetical protein
MNALLRLKKPETLTKIQNKVDRRGFYHSSSYHPLGYTFVHSFDGLLAVTLPSLLIL